MYLAGGLIDTPELRFTPNGNAVAQFRLAQSEHRKNEQGEWVKTHARYIDCVIWDETRGQTPKQWAHAISELTKGTRVVVYGKLKTRTWEDKEGNWHAKLEFTADAFYVDGLVGIPAPQQSQQRQSTQSDPWANTPTQIPGGDEQPPF